jgi:outer membrane protein TolC
MFAIWAVDAVPPAGAQIDDTPVERVSDEALTAASLALEEVLQSVDAHYPLLAAAAQEAAIAEGQLEASRGGFDLRLTTVGQTEQLGYYQNRLLDVLVEQPTQLLGATLYSGYSIGRGNFPDWRGNLETLSDGEIRLGINLPLLQDREVDAGRARLRAAEAGVDRAAGEVAKARLVFLKSAAKGYWDWVAQGRQLEIARTLLALAEQRMQQVEDAVDFGDLPAIETLDNRRAILERRSAVLLGKQLLEQSAIELGLYLRDSSGAPLAPGAELLPQRFPAIEELLEVALARDLALALERRPEMAQALAKRRQAQVGLELADNQVTPSFDLKAEYSRDFGEGSVTKVGDELKAGFLFTLPLQRREGRGKRAAERARLVQLDAEIRFLRDRIRADVESAALAVRTAFERARLVRQEVELAEQLQTAETERFELGDSTLFVVNLRELATAAARLREVKALADYHKAHADYRAATGDLIAQPRGSSESGA